MSGTMSPPLPGLVADPQLIQQLAAMQAMQQPTQSQQPAPSQSQPPPSPPPQTAPQAAPQPPPQAPAPQAPPPQQPQGYASSTLGALGNNNQTLGGSILGGIEKLPGLLWGNPSSPQQPPSAPAAPAAAPNVPPPGVAARLQAAQQAAGTQQPQQPQAAPQAAPAAAPAAPPKPPRDYDALSVQDWTAESQFKNVNNPNSSASGPGQITDGTFSQFVQSPANAWGYTMKDKNNPQAQLHASNWLLRQNDQQMQAGLGRPVTDGELNSSYMLGPNGATALLKNPTANAYDTLKNIEPGTVDAVFSGNGGVINKNMTGAEAVTAIGNFYANGGQTHGGGGGRAGGGGPGGGQSQSVIGADFTSDQSPSARLAAAQQAMQPGGGNGNFDLSFMNDPGFQQLAQMMKPSPFQQIEAVAGGLLQGPGLAGLGKGLESMNQLNMQGRQTMGQLANMGLENERFAQMMGYRNAQLGQNQEKVDQGWGRLNQGDQRIAQGDTRLAQQAQSITNRASGANAYGSETGKTSGEDYNELQEGAQTDALARENITGAIQELQRNPGMFGPTAQAAAQRTLAMWGLGDPGQLQAYQKMTADQQSKYLESATGGHMGSVLRSFGSQKMFAQAVAHADTDPSAAQYVFDSQLSMVNARDALRAQVNQDPGSWQGPQFATKEQQFYTDYFKQHPLPVYRPGYTSTMGGSPNASAAPSGNNAKGVQSGSIKLPNGQSIPFSYTPNQ
jgi:hypothetical protein